jgi:hypothetical protein
VLVGGNQGAVMSVGDVVGGDAAWGGRGGDATLAVNGTDIASLIQLDLQANGGSATASANGGDDNSALFDATDAAQLSGLDLLAGVGGVAVAEANAGSITVGDLLAGENVGTVVAFGDIAGGDAWDGGQGESQVFYRDGGSILAVAQIAAAANGGESVAVADGGDGNAVLLVADATTTIGDVPRAGNGGSVLSQANAGPVTVGNVTSGQNRGTTFVGPESAEADKDDRAPKPTKPGKSTKPEAAPAKPGGEKPGKATADGYPGAKKVVTNAAKAQGAGKGSAAKNVKRLPSTGEGVFAAEQGAGGGLLPVLALLIGAASLGLRRRLAPFISDSR